MVKLLLILVALILFFYFLKSNKKDFKKDGEEVMVECKKCGTFVSIKEAIIKDSNYYCSKECANG